MSGQDQYGDYDYTRRGNQGGEYEGQQDYNGRGGEQPAQHGGRSASSGYGNRRTEGAYDRGGGEAGAYGARGAEQTPQAGEYGQAGEHGNREYRSYRRGEYRPRSDYSRGGEYARGEYGRRATGDYGAGGGEPPRSRRDVIGVIASSLFAVLALLALVFVIYIVVTRGDDPPSTSANNTPTGPTTGQTEPTGGETSEPPAPADRAPVIVLNSTDRTGLALKVDKDLADGGWETGEPDNFDGETLTATTVFYPEGLEGSARRLQEEFPDIADVKPAEANMSTESLTLVIGSDWP